MNLDVLTSDRFQREILEAASKCNKLKEKTVRAKLQKVLRKYDSLMSYSLETKNHFYCKYKKLREVNNDVKSMERFILKFTNGKILQQKGINGTYHHLLGLGVISYIIDTKDGEIMYGDKDESVHTEKITKYNDCELITPKD